MSDLLSSSITITSFSTGCSLTFWLGTITDWWFILIFFISGTSEPDSGDVSVAIRFSSLTDCSTLFAVDSSFSGGIVGVPCAALVVVQELPLLIFKIIRGESQPESEVFELVVMNSVGCRSQSSVDGSLNEEGDVAWCSDSGICFNVVFVGDLISEF